MAAARTFAGTRDCKKCGAAFLMRADLAKDLQRGKYCSVKCSNSARTTRPLTADDASLRTLYVEQQMSIRQVADATGQNWKRVMFRLRELGVMRPPGREGRGQKRSASATYRKRLTVAPGQVVHHIDHNPLNNAPSNLVAVSRRQHSAFHKELEMLSIELYKKGLVLFDAAKGYTMAPRLLALLGE